MARCCGLLAPLIISLFLTIPAKEQEAKQDAARSGLIKFHHDNPIQARTAVRAPNDVQLVATCDHFIRASWTQKGDKVDGFEVTLTEEFSNVTQKLTLAATERHVAFKIDPYRQNFTFTIRSYIYRNKQRNLSDEVEERVTSIGQAPDVGRFQALPLTSTSARITWTTPHSEDIHISVCAAAHSDEDCVEYTTDGNLLMYVINTLKPATRYLLHASFSLALNGQVCKYKRSSQTIVTPAKEPPSLQAWIVGISETTVTISVERLSEGEFFVVRVNELEQIYHDNIFTLRGLAPGRKYLLLIAACVDYVTCRAQTELEVTTPAEPPSPIVKIVEARNTSIVISWTFTEADNETNILYQVGYQGVRQSFYHFTSDHHYEFDGLVPNSTYIIYVEAFNMKNGSVKIGNPGFVTAFTDTEELLPPTPSSILENIEQALSTDFTTGEGRTRKEGKKEEGKNEGRMNQSYLTPNTSTDSLQHLSSAQFALLVSDLLSVFTPLLWCLLTFKR